MLRRFRNKLALRRSVEALAHSFLPGSPHNAELERHRLVAALRAVAERIRHDGDAKALDAIRRLRPTSYPSVPFDAHGEFERHLREALD